MNILGLSVFCDASAAMLQNNALICAVEEERLNRIKHFEGFPWKAITEVLSLSNISYEMVDHVAVGWNPYIGWQTRIIESLKSFLYSPTRFVTKARRGSGYIQRCKELFNLRKFLEDGLESKNSKVGLTFVNHHKAHAASAFFLSPWEKANIVVADGVGESDTLSFFKGVNNNLFRIHTITFPHSLGHVYASITKFLGFRPCHDEGKVMALAAYGKNQYAELFNKLITVNMKSLDLRIDTKMLDYHMARLGIFSSDWIRATGLMPRSVHDSLCEDHKNLAASLQQRIEECVLQLANRIFNKSTLPLCTAGGLFLNVVMNGRIQRESNRPFFVQPAAGDNGVSIGSALITASQHTPNFDIEPLQSVALGRAYTSKEIEEILHTIPNNFGFSKNICADTAKLIAHNKIIGWFHGKMEFGPRALGNRSILANPLNPKVKKEINDKVKHREEFRPYACSVLLNEGYEYFEKFYPSPFMLKTYFFKQKYRHVFPAITHVDNSCRVQTVSKEYRCYYNLLLEIKKLIGYGIILNTSMNTRGQPIVNTPEQAIELLNSTQLDYLILHNYIVKSL